MRRRLITAVVVALAVHAWGARPAGGQQNSPASGGSELGLDQEAQSSIDSDGGGADVGASFELTVDGGTPTTGSPAEGGPVGRRVATPQIRCSLWSVDDAGPSRELPTTESLRTLWDRRLPGTTALNVLRTCYDANGFIISSDPTTWAPGAEGEPPAPVIDPAVLAGAARSRLTFPAPVPRTSPDLEGGTFAQLPTAFWVEGWGASSASASAGPVTATVTATPVSQQWTIRDAVRRAEDSVVCDGPGAPAVDGQAGACGWTPSHSSAGQQTRGGSAGEPCFPTTVTVTWDVGWQANVPGAGGPLGQGTSSTDTCLVVAELQAVVSEAG